MFFSYSERNLRRTNCRGDTVSSTFDLQPCHRHWIWPGSSRLQDPLSAGMSGSRAAEKLGGWKQTVPRQPWAHKGDHSVLCRWMVNLDHVNKYQSLSNQSQQASLWKIPLVHCEPQLVSSWGNAPGWKRMSLYSSYGFLFFLLLEPLSIQHARHLWEISNLDKKMEHLLVHRMMAGISKILIWSRAEVLSLWVV